MADWKFIIIDQPTVYVAESENWLRSKSMYFLDREITTHPNCFLDMPGAIAIGRPIEDFYFDGLKLQIPSEDLADVIFMIAAAQDEEGFVSIDAWIQRLVVTVKMRDDLLVLLTSRIREAEARATAFYADPKSVSEILQEANAGA